MKSKKLGCLLIAAVVGGVIVVLDWIIPPYTFDPFCTYDLTARHTATIDVDGRPYSSEVTQMNSFSRKWIAIMNSAGCQQTHGTALAFRLPDNRVVLMSPRFCLRQARRRRIRAIRIEQASRR